MAENENFSALIDTTYLHAMPRQQWVEKKVFVFHILYYSINWAKTDLLHEKRLEPVCKVCEHDILVMAGFYSLLV